MEYPTTCRGCGEPLVSGDHAVTHMYQKHPRVVATLFSRVLTGDRPALDELWALERDGGI